MRAFAAATTFVRNEQQYERAFQSLTSARSEYSKALPAAVAARDKISDHVRENNRLPLHLHGVFLGKIGFLRP